MPNNNNLTHQLDFDERQFILVGTAHVSKESAQLVRPVIEEEKPDLVAIAQDAQQLGTTQSKGRG